MNSIKDISQKSLRTSATSAAKIYWEAFLCKFIPLNWNLILKIQVI